MQELRMAVVGLGRIGAMHALHAAELASERDDVAVTALVDPDTERAHQVARELSGKLGLEAGVFSSLSELLAAGVSDAALVSTPTHLHREHAGLLVRAGHRVLLEKPLTDSLRADREFVQELSETAPNSIMLGLQRRFDPPMKYAKQLLDEGSIGRPFKVVSILEDSNPVPDGYSSPGILNDMSVHNVDEVLWLFGGSPSEVMSVGSNIYSHRLSTAEEDFDDATIQMWFPGGEAAQVMVSRNHVSGYHVETWIFGEKGQIHAGHFDQNRREVLLEAYGRDSVIEKKSFPMREYEGPMPEFVDRFGPAYIAEVEEFFDRCRSGEPFPVNQNDGLRAMEVIDAASRNVVTRNVAGRVGPPAG